MKSYKYVDNERVEVLDHPILTQENILADMIDQRDKQTINSDEWQFHQDRINYNFPSN